MTIEEGGQRGVYGGGEGRGVSMEGGRAEGCLWMGGGQRGVYGGGEGRGVTIEGGGQRGDH